ncbi:hypothetical protein ADK52_32695 [Streptomyces sp. WM6372]|uniref:hypothetical protein n=1 Tax=Streptomyces sp. WM6372 TaxID=1415555 RepID=UPI0006AE341F|nr:hypothetical protein [Streptomyces sp. WM6372]KOU16860.1 hypothetical protein ADK52_32695 [Streptomyces sp. WM6372]
MAEAVPVRCPACLRENDYAAPVFPCACGSPVAPPLDLAAPPLPLTHRTWSDTWVAVRCAACGRVSEWPHPELGCASCGTVVRIPVHPVEPASAPGGGVRDARDVRDTRDVRDGLRPRPDVRGEVRGDARGDVWGQARSRSGGPGGTGPGGPGSLGRPPAASAQRPAFHPVTIRTARDAVATAALYLRWLGFQDVRQPDGRPIPSAAVDLRAPGLVAQVDPTTAPAGLRAVECVWLNGLTASATSVYFALAGYTQDARSRADDLGIPLFVMDLTGMPQPVNDPADALVGPGA